MDTALCQTMLKGINADCHSMTKFRIDAACPGQIVLGEISVLEEFLHIDHIVIHVSLILPLYPITYLSSCISSPNSPHFREELGEEGGRCPLLQSTFFSYEPLLS